MRLWRACVWATGPQHKAGFGHGGAGQFAEEKEKGRAKRAAGRQTRPAGMAPAFYKAGCITLERTPAAGA